MFDCFFNDTATTEIYTYGHTSSLHDALPIYLHRPGRRSGGIARRVAEALDEPGGARSALLFLSPASLGRCGCADHASHFHAASRAGAPLFHIRSEEHTSELQSLMRISYAVFCLKKK